MNPPDPIRILHLDDSEFDHLLVKREIESKKLPVSFTFVQTPEEYAAALHRRDVDIILSDYRMPAYNGDQAMALARELCPDIPFIMVTGELGEDRAIETLQRGAWDYILKDNLRRLVPAIQRALEEADARRQRHEAVRALQKSERELRLITDISPVYIIRIDRDQRYTFVNRAYAERYGLDPAAIVGRTVREIVGEEIYRVIQPSMEITLQGVPFTGDLLFPYPQLGIRTLHVLYVPETDDHGTVCGLVGTLLDVTEQRMAAERVRAERNRSEEILESIQDGFFVVDKDWTLSYVNRRAEELWGMGREALIGKNLWEVFPPEPGARSYALFTEAMAAREAKNFELQSTVINRWLDVNVYPKADGGLAVYFRDVHERKQVDDQIHILAAVVENSTDFIAICNRALQPIFVNTAGRKMVGIDSLRDALRIPLPDYFAPEDRTRFESEAVPALFRDGRSNGHARLLHQQSGLLTRTIWNAFAIHDKEGNAVAWAVICPDLSKLEETSEALRIRAGLIDISPDGMFIRGSDDRITFWSPGAERLYGWTTDDAIGHSPHEILATESSVPLDEVNRLLREHGRWEGELYHRRKDGGVVSVYSRWILNDLDHDGRYEIFESNVDISDRRRIAAERELLLAEIDKQRRMFEGVIRHAPIGIGIMHGARHHFITVNPVLAAALSGRGDLIGQRLEEIVPEIAGQVVPVLDGVFTSGKPVSLDDIRMKISRDGRSDEGIFTFIFAPWYNEQGLTEGVMTLVMESTARKQIENDLRESREQLANIIGAAMDAVITVDEGQKVILFNAAAEKMFNVSAEEAIGSRLDRFIPQRFRDAHRNHIKTFGAAHTTRRSMGSLGKLYAARSNGEEFPIEASISQIEVNGRKLFTVILRDITERVKAEAEVYQLQHQLERRVLERTEELERLNKELESFSYSVSHDLRAPLRAITGYANILLEDVLPLLPSESQRHLRTISESALRMGELIDYLLAFSRLNQESLSRQSIDMHALFAEALAEHRAGDSLGTKVMLKDLPPITGDATLMRQVVINLVSNAWKYTRKTKHPEIEVGARREAGRTVYFVRDNGAGFNPAKADKLFGVFQRLHSEEEFEGIGIGLANVRRIVERHGGTVWSASDGEGKGASFYFALPDDQK